MTGRKRSVVDDWKADQERDAPWAERLRELATQRGEQPIEITPNSIVPASLAREWFIGMRPLPGQNEEYYFSAVADMVGSKQAMEWRERHARLRAQEMGAASDTDLPSELADELIRRGWRPPPMARRVAEENT